MLLRQYLKNSVLVIAVVEKSKIIGEFWKAADSTLCRKIGYNNLIKKMSIVAYIVEITDITK